ncbi:Hsp20/alpha crystallin family protein [Haloferax sp. AB510]|uniref:Hsp20/alpha crystallin family protein n=1 Tax=Haloferax sp. AB510 TaxID=2934172 RepID=UPI00209C4659|nr:Hsp20/alpha crystallin family protein [Haloferax sp. AB510]MCO8267386.1 Hsp20/alpha crystallin family protein [Haloferax sp. AB510]
MSMQQFAGGNERFIRRYEYEDCWVIAVDVGLSEDEVDVDIVGSTAIVVADLGDRVTETEFELPAGGDADVAVRNGVLTITLTK